MYRLQKDSEEIRDGLSDLYMGAWEPNISNGASGASWGRRDDHGREGQSGVDLCWDKDGSIAPLSLSDMTEEEREVCYASC
jgi:PERQ amino acid-rich with GYF domain-containing protein